MQATMGRAGRATVVVVALAAVVAACSNPGATAGPPTGAPATAAVTAAPATSGPASAAPTMAAALTIEVRQDATLGAFVTGKDGMTLYMFTADSGGKSACSGDCAAAWPPLTVAAAADVAAGSAVTGALATITRDDGTLQVTLGGLPLYYYSGDKAAGDTTGQGLFEKWYLVSPAGTAIQAPPGGAAATTCTGPTCY
jgi:predicted lipoprotein with Yx(FWY)xxD motif